MVLNELKPSQEDFKKFLKGRKFIEDFYKFSFIYGNEYEHLIDKHKIDEKE